jgi:hypothetical protein
MPSEACRRDSALAHDAVWDNQIQQLQDLLTQYQDRLR